MAAPSKSITGGGFQDALGNLVTGNLLLILSQDAHVASSGQVAPVSVRIPVNGGGIASTPIWFNDQLSPSNLAYTATVYDSTGNKVYGPELWSLTGAGPVDLGLLTPLLISPDPLFSNPVLQNPSAAQTIMGQSLTLAGSAPLIVNSPVVFTGTFAPSSITPPVVINTVNAVTLAFSNPAAPRTVTFPDFGANDSLVAIAAAQSLSNKTLVNALAIPASTVGFGFTVQGLASQVSSPFVVQTNGGASTLLAITAAGNAQVLGVIQNAGGTATMGLTLKTGSGAGNYTGVNTAFVAVDTTNLCATFTVPTGWKLKIDASGVLESVTAAVAQSVALADAGATCTSGGITALNGTRRDITPPAAGTFDVGFSTSYVFTGDGAAHSILLVALTSAAADAWGVQNTSATAAPSLIYTLMPSN